MKNLQKIRDLTWEDVFNIWRENEENLEHWKQFWSTQGFSSWEAWRTHTHVNLHGEKLSWALHEVTNPAETISKFRGGPFRAWMKWFYPLLETVTPTFEQLITHPGIQNHHFILELTESFPSPTTISAVKTPDGIIVVEGMHRACALALSKLQNRPVQSKIFVALAESDTPLSILGGEKRN